MRRKSEKGYIEDDVFSEYSTGGIESGQRVLWCQLPSVRNSGVLTDLEPREKKRQEVRPLNDRLFGILSLRKVETSLVRES